MRRLLPIFCALLLSGCAGYAPPAPWEKDRLAKPEMAMDADPLEQRYQQHIYSSKENSAGGWGVGGGGCGCN
ncbi:MAG TPA: DUF4266 domain-containing protein [Methylibium sp.]|nr:DUF4266 domain-containing protein [Methylibium sp.]